jgi:hypothetical protein
VYLTYVGNHGYSRLGAFQGGQRQNLNAVDIGAAYLPQNQDPTLGTSAIPGATAYTTNLLRPYRGYAGIEENQTEFWDTYHSLQTNVLRRFRNGFSFGVNYTWGISFEGNTGLNKRFQHASDGTMSLRADQGAYETLMKTLDRRPHILKANAVWNIPGTPDSQGAVLRGLTNGWQIAGVLTAGSGTAYDLGYTYQSSGANVNITGSPDWGGRVILLDGLGSGCSNDQYAQFDASAVVGPGYGSVGMESGRNYLRGCPDKRVDLSLMRQVRLGGNRRLEFRAQLYNAFNAVVITARNTTANFNNPTSMTLVNNQFAADGSLNPSRLQPRNAGFGAATNAEALRSVELQVRFLF